MNSLLNESCEACRVGASLVTDQEVTYYLQELPDWQIRQRDGINQLFRQYTFKDFKQAMVFANHIGELAEAVQHHPSITVDWGKVEIVWWTHKIRGLHKNDFIMAAKSDVAYSN